MSAMKVNQTLSSLDRYDQALLKRVGMLIELMGKHEERKDNHDGK